MPRIDDYKMALRLGKERLKDRNPHLICRYAGMDIEEKESNIIFKIRWLNRDVEIQWPEFHMEYVEGGRELPIQESILILHYINGCMEAGQRELTNNWISFKDIPDGRFYLDAFNKRAKDPLVDAFGKDPDLLIPVISSLYAGEALDLGDVSIKISPLPLIRVLLVMWKGDEEFPPEGNILFDENISQILSAEDIAWLSQMIVFPAVGELRRYLEGKEVR